MDRRVADLHGLRHLEQPCWRADAALIADLAALLRVEAGAVEQHADFRVARKLALGVDLVIRDPAQHTAFARRPEPLWPIIGGRQAAADVERHLCGGRLAA